MNAAPMPDKTFTDAEKPSSCTKPYNSNQHCYLQPTTCKLVLLALLEVNKSPVNAENHVI